MRNEITTTIQSISTYTKQRYTWYYNRQRHIAVPDVVKVESLDESVAIFKGATGLRLNPSVKMPAWLRGWQNKWHILEC